MSRKYLAFLGTNEYLECYYTLQHKATSEPCRFIQEALIRVFCQNWTKEDSILIFTTDEAKQKNWESCYFGERYIGLQDRLSQLHLSCVSSQIDIPEGDCVEALWKIFDTVFEHVGNQDELIFDMTHGFRSLPMLALIILNYAKFIKNCTLAGMYYGAFETLGPIYQVKEKPVEQRIVPVFDLTPFVSLFDWTVGIDRFLNTGDASVIASLTNEVIPQILKESDNQYLEHTCNLRKIVQAIFNFSQNSVMCRRKELTYSALTIPEYLDRAILSSEQILKPLTPLLKTMQERFQAFAPDQELANMFHIVRWCSDRNLIQQGLTLLYEGIITELNNRLGLRGETYHERQIVTTAIRLMKMKDPAGLSQQFYDKYHLTFGDVQQCFPEPSAQFLSIFETLRQARNAINHGGSRKKASFFRQSLKQSLAKLEPLFLGAGQPGQPAL